MASFSRTTAFTLFFSIFTCLPLKVAICQGGGTDNIKTELFSANAQLAMAEKDYKVTAGDVYTLSFYQNGAGSSYTIIVDSTYKSKLPPAEPVALIRHKWPATNCGKPRSSAFHLSF